MPHSSDATRSVVDGLPAPRTARHGGPHAVALATPALRFLVVGGLNTALGFVLFHALLRAFGGRPRAAGLAQALAYAAGIAISYAANRGWTFRSDRAHRRALPWFVAVELGALSLSATLVHLGTGVAGLAPSLSWLGATGVTAVLNFVAQRYVVFPPRGPAGLR